MGIDGGSLLEALERISVQMSDQVSYCASCWVQDGLSPLAWADEEALVPAREAGESAGEGRELSLSAAAAFDPAVLKGALLTVAAASCQGEGEGEGEGAREAEPPSSYQACKIYLGDQFLEQGQDQDAAVCGLHVFSSSGHGRLRLAMICEGADPFDVGRRRDLFQPISDLLHQLEQRA